MESLFINARILSAAGIDTGVEHFLIHRSANEMSISDIAMIDDKNPRLRYS